jgi:hypothetical protein
VTTQLERPETVPSFYQRYSFLLSPLPKLAAVYAGVVVLVLFAHNARHGAVAGRIRNPAVTGAPRPLGPTAGWTALEDVGTVVAGLVIVTLVVLAWRIFPKHPVILMVVATTGIVWQDPLMNWSPYAVYNPQLWHLPETWAWVKLSPTVEPFVVLGYTMFYLGPFFPGIWLLRRLQKDRPAEAFVRRHPLVSLGLLIFVIGFVFDAVLEISLIHTQMYIYSQVIPFGSVFVGKTFQFPLLWESSLVTLVMIPAGLLLHRDDTGRTQAEKLAARLRFTARRPALGAFVVMFAVVNIAYFLYGGGFELIRITRAATSVACPWPYPEAKIYDPQGFYAKAGQPGPYAPGVWHTWASGRTTRPDTPTASTGRCAPGHG